MCLRSCSSADAVNVMDRSVLGVLVESIKHEFGASDTMLGAPGWHRVRPFYATFGIPSRRGPTVPVAATCSALAVLMWSVMTAFCGLATTFWWLLLARIGTAIGEAGGTPPSHSLISDYFSLRRRATALPLCLGRSIRRHGRELCGWMAQRALRMAARPSSWLRFQACW